jgi:hypothetical protein
MWFVKTRTLAEALTVENYLRWLVKTPTMAERVESYLMWLVKTPTKAEEMWFVKTRIMPEVKTQPRRKSLKVES